jgi:hypothetical protein
MGSWTSWTQALAEVSVETPATVDLRPSQEQLRVELPRQVAEALKQQEVQVAVVQQVRVVAVQDSTVVVVVLRPILVQVAEVRH